MLALLALFYYLDANFAIKYLLGYTSMILFMFFLTFILIEFSFFTPVDTLNLALRCSPSYPRFHFWPHVRSDWGHLWPLTPILTHLKWEMKKKKNTFFYYFFKSNPNLQSDLILRTLKFWPPWEIIIWPPDLWPLGTCTSRTFFDKTNT